ncbi:MAG: hypothetical protein M1839_002968 [Geoglossum umbratile]|nr:MAG: hypothetical protein M1839_002968 [Geoglossum umbratile]
MAAPSKRTRKGTLSFNPPSKRLSNARSADKPKASPSRRGKAKQADDNTDKLWTVRAIQAEKGNKYLIDWEDDPVTGESYAPTWEPKANANKEAIDHWEEQKRLKATATPTAKSTAAASAPAFATKSISSKKRQRKSESGSASASTTNVTADDSPSQEPPSKRARLLGVGRKRDHQGHPRKRHSQSPGSSSRRAASEAAPAELPSAAEAAGSRASLADPHDNSEIEDSYILEEIPISEELQVPAPPISKPGKPNYSQSSSDFLSPQTQQSLGSPPGLAPIATDAESLIQVIHNPQTDHLTKQLPLTFDPESTILDSQSVQESSGQSTAPRSLSGKAISATGEETRSPVRSTSPAISESASDHITNTSGLVDRVHASESSDNFNSPGTSPPSSSDTPTVTEGASKAAIEDNIGSPEHPYPNQSRGSSKQTTSGDSQPLADSVNQLEQDKPGELSWSTTSRGLVPVVIIRSDARRGVTSEPAIDESLPVPEEAVSTLIAENATLKELSQEEFANRHTEGASEGQIDRKARPISDSDEGGPIPHSFVEQNPPAEILQPADVSRPVETPQPLELPQVAEVEPSKLAETSEPVETTRPAEEPQLKEAYQPEESPGSVQILQQIEVPKPLEALLTAEPTSQQVEASVPIETLQPETQLPVETSQRVKRPEPLSFSQPAEPPEPSESPRLAEYCGPVETPQLAESLLPTEISQQPPSEPSKHPEPIEFPKLPDSAQLVGRSEPEEVLKPTESPVPAETPQQVRPLALFGIPQPVESFEQVDAPVSASALRPLEGSRSAGPPELTGNSQLVDNFLLLETPRPAEPSQSVETLQSAGQSQLVAESRQVEALQAVNNFLPVETSQAPETLDLVEASRGAESLSRVESPLLAEASSPQPTEKPLPLEAPQPAEDPLLLGISQLLEENLSLEALQPIEASQPAKIKAPQQAEPPLLQETPGQVNSPQLVEAPQLVDSHLPAEPSQPLRDSPSVRAFDQTEPFELVEAPQLAETPQSVEPLGPVESLQNLKPPPLLETSRPAESYQLVEFPPSLPVTEGSFGIPQDTDPATRGESSYYQAAQKIPETVQILDLTSEELDSKQDTIFQTQVPPSLDAGTQVSQTQREERIQTSGRQGEAQGEGLTTAPISFFHTASYTGPEVNWTVDLAENRQGPRNRKSPTAPISPIVTESNQTRSGAEASHSQNSEGYSWQAAQVVSPFTNPISQIPSNDNDTDHSHFSGTGGDSANQWLPRTAKPPKRNPIETRKNKEGNRPPNAKRIQQLNLNPDSPSSPLHVSPAAEQIAQIADYRNPNTLSELTGRRVSTPEHLQNNSYTKLDQCLRKSPIPLPPPRSSERHDSLPSAQALQPPSDESMSDGYQPMSTPPGGLTLRERLNNLNANRAAKRVMREESMKSARSTVSPTRVTEEQAQPAEAPPLSRSSHGKGSSLAGSIRIPDLGKMEFIVPLPLNNGARDHYQQTVNNYLKEIEAFLQTESEPDIASVGQMKEMLDKASKVAIHPDLNSSDKISPQGDPEEDKIRRSEEFSSKFSFLRHFLEAIRSQKLHVAILAESKRLLDTLELLLKARRFKFNRPDRPDNNRAEMNFKLPGQMTITLQESGEMGAVYVASNADLVIALDRTFNPHDRHVEVMRNHVFIVGKKCPVFHLVVQNSVEHVDLCIPLTLERRLQAVVYCVAQTRHGIGLLPPEYPAPALAADLLAKWISSGGEEGLWPLPPMGSIKNVEVFTNSQASDPQQTFRGVREHSGKADDVHNAQKRPSADESDPNLGPQKKLRPGNSLPAQTTVSGQPEVSRVYGTTNYQPPDPALVTANEEKVRAAVTPEETHPAMAAAIEEPQFQSQIAKPPQQIGRAAVLRQEGQSTEARLQDFIKDFEDLQTKYEDHVQEMRGLRAERDDALSALKQSETRRDQMAVENFKLMEEREGAQALLNQARADLIGSSRLDVARTVIDREQAQKGKTEKERLEKKVNDMNRELDFFRAQYQEASSAAAEAGSEVDILKDEIEIWKRKASGEAAKLRQMAISTENERQSQRILELEATLKERDEYIRRKEEEVKSQARGKSAMMRASSTPKSPRPSRAGSPTGNTPTATTNTAAPHSGGYGLGPAIGATGRGGHPLRYAGHPLPTE